MSTELILSISLVSHTNTGKTTLARTLLRRDVGTVLDQAHVTDTNERFSMLEIPPQPDGEPGGRIELWDTAGFGDSARLHRELEKHEDPLSWMAAQTWDPVHERALYSSQRAVNNVAEHADVVLYLVNASEDPEMAGYVEPEMRILGWMDRPVIVVLNQTGSPTDAEARRAAEERWRWHLASHAAVRDVLCLDAFTRCWVQEGLLLLRLQALVKERHRTLMTRLLDRWQEENLSILDASARAIAELLWQAALDREPVGEALLSRAARRRSVTALTQRLAAATQRTTDGLIELHGLEGESAAWARGQLEDVSVPGDRPDPTRASVLGGVVGGALGGLVADIASAGMSLGGGAILGALLGGLGLGGLAWAYDQLGGDEPPAVIWSHRFLVQLTRNALLRYLAVAHFGRGAGEYRDRVEPTLWHPIVDRLLEGRARSLRSLLGNARHGKKTEATRAKLTEEIDALLRESLMSLYPGTERLLRSRTGTR